jgi:hypothetical protein
MRLAHQHLPEKVGQVEDLIEIIEDETSSIDDVQEARAQLADTIRPAIKEVVNEVAVHESVKDALAFVRYDLASRPEISYRWLVSEDALEVEYVKKSRDQRGNEFIEDVVTLRFIPDTAIPIPNEVRSDLIKRLPIKNRTLDAN